jgi:hypothetical protein
MPSDPDLHTLAQAVIRKNRDSTRDSCGTQAESLSQGALSAGTGKTSIDQGNTLTVPPSQALGSGTAGQCENNGTAHGTVVGQHYKNVLAALRSECPELVDAARWQRAVQDAEGFLATWGAQAHGLGWTARELFGLHQVPSRPAATYRRLSRYDATGLIWLLDGRTVIALSEGEAAIRGHSGSVTVYRKHHKPALGPLGDCLDDLGPCA